MLRTLARRVARFDWQRAPNDVAAILYETVIPHLTNDGSWANTTPLTGWRRASYGNWSRIPSISTFLTRHAVPELSSRRRSRIFSKPRLRPPWIPKRYWSGWRFSVSGIDVHPVAVHLARSAWVLAAQPAIEAAVRSGFAGNLTVPIYLGDALQLRFRAGDMFAQRQITIQVDGDQNKELIFPVSLVDRAEIFRRLDGGHC